jgi:ABC-type branched-subunit amino acid transport system substrate-binding protein
VKAASCDGFKNQTGITDEKIVLANASDISGPVPGLFQSAQDATRAFVAYYNATTTLCGRSLEVLALDTRTDAGGDQQAYTRACSDAFAVVGSASGMDQGGAATAAGCGIPDLRAINTTPDRTNCDTCFATYAVRTNEVATTLPKYYLAREKDASQHVGIFYVNVPAAAINAESISKGYEKSGMNVDILQSIDVAEFNYSPYVQQMKDKGIDFVQYFGPYQFAIRLQQAMQQQSFEPTVFLEDPSIYDQNYVEQAGSAGEGSQVFSTVEMLDNTKIPEMVLYRQWLAQVKPGAVPNYYGLFAWSAARLFVERAAALGGKLTRASLVASLAKVDNWTSNGLHAPMHVGSKKTSGCIKIIQLDGGTWHQRSSGDFMCGPTVDTGVGG